MVTHLDEERQTEKGYVSFRQVDQHIVPRARSSHHPIRKITGTFPSTSLLVLRRNQWGEIRRLHVQLPSTSNYYRASPIRIEKGHKSHTPWQSHWGLLFLFISNNVLDSFMSPSKWKKFKVAKENITLSMIWSFEQKKDLIHLDYDCTGLLERIWVG